MAGIRVGGDPESYMDPPVLSGGGGESGGGDGTNFVNSMLELLGIHRNVARGAKEKVGKKLDKTAKRVTGGSADDFLDQTGAALLRQDTLNYQPVKLIDLPPGG